MPAAITSSAEVQSWYTAFNAQFVQMGLKLGYRTDEVSDLVSQFFLDLLEKNIDPRTIQNPRAYLTTAFRRKLVDHYRQTGRKQLVDVELVPENLAEPSMLDALEQVQSNAALVRSIRVAYNNLPARCRKVIYLKFYEGLSTEQIALQTGLSKRSVYNNLFEGIKLLRAALSQAQPGIQIAALIAVLPLLVSTMA